MPKKIFCLLIMGSLLFSLSGCGKENTKESASEEKGVAYFRKGEYRKALPLLRKSADSGNAAASCYLGVMYRDGKGLDKNTGKSCKWFLKAAEGGHSDAWLATSLCYMTENGLGKNDREAFRWAKKAATGESGMELNDRRILASLLGNRFFTGEGTPVDYAKAAKWYEKAAELGDHRAQGVLAFQYFSGKGVLIDRERAKHWARLAAASPNDMKEFASAILQLLEDPPDMKKAVYWYERSAKRGNPLAQEALAVLYEKGEGVRQNLVRAHQYYRLAAKNGDESMKKALADFEANHSRKQTD